MDVPSCMRHMYQMKDTDWISGGQFKELAASVSKFISLFMSIGCKLVLFYDGMPVEDKHIEWVKRKKDLITEVNSIFDCLYKDDLKNATDRNQMQLPSCAWEVVKKIFLASPHCKV